MCIGVIKHKKELKMSKELDNIFMYHAPKGDQPARYEKLRAAAKQFAECVEDCCPPCYDRDVAIRKIREAVMTANSSIAIQEA
jgi:hypothetical protein